LCHLTVQSALAQGQYSTSVLSQKLAIWLGILHVSLVFWLGSAAAAVCHSSPWLEARGLLARIVNCYKSNIRVNSHKQIANSQKIENLSFTLIETIQEAVKRLVDSMSYGVQTIQIH